MELKNILETLEKYTSKDILAALDILEDQNRKICCETADACRDYFADVEQQKTAVAQQIAKFKEDIAGIDHQIKAMQPTLVRATAQGNSGDLERIQEKLTDYEARKAALAAQIQLLQSAPIKGSRELVKAADAKEVLRYENSCIYDDAIKEARDTARWVSEDLRILADKLKYPSSFGCREHERMHEHLSAKPQVPDTQAVHEDEPINLCTGVHVFGAEDQGNGPSFADHPGNAKRYCDSW